MDYPTKLFILILLLASCNSSPSEITSGTTAGKKTESLPVNDTIPRVTGIGGIFFGTDNPEETRAWYGKNLGIAIDDYGSPFEFRNANRPDEVNYLRWSPMKHSSDQFTPSGKTFMINYRVQHIEKLVGMLRNNGVTILDSIQTFDYGKFVHLLDPDGNKIELWEPVDSVLTQLGGKTTK